MCIDEKTPERRHMARLFPSVTMVRACHRQGRLLKIFRFALGMATFAFLILAPSPLTASEATNQLSTTIEGFVTIITNTPVAELQAKGLSESARKLILARFDFSEMTKRSLGPHWKLLDPAEQREFVDAFTHRLLVAYGKTLRATGDEKIQFLREVRDGNEASVETKVLSPNGDETPIDYRLHELNGQWKVYDVLIDNVSVVNNYRAQFDRVIAKSSVEELLQRVKDHNPPGS